MRRNPLLSKDEKGGTGCASPERLGWPVSRLFVCSKLKANPSAIVPGGGYHAEVDIADSLEESVNERIGLALADPELLDLRPVGLVRLVFDF